MWHTVKDLSSCLMILALHKVRIKEIEVTNLINYDMFTVIISWADFTRLASDKSNDVHYIHTHICDDGTILVFGRISGAQVQSQPKSLDECKEDLQRVYGVRYED